MTTPTDYVLPFDKYRGQTLGQVLQKDPAYVTWLARKMVPRDESGRTLQAMAAAVLRKPSPRTQTLPRIYSQMTRTVILHVEDALDIAKVRFFLISYRRGRGASATVAHYLDLADARVLASDLAKGRLATRFVDYKGSAQGKTPESRVLRIDDRGDAQRAPIVLQVSKGPGQVVGEGAVKPAGKAQVEIAILLTRWQARRLGCALRDYLLAWQCRQLLRHP